MKRLTPQRKKRVEQLVPWILDVLAVQACAHAQDAAKYRFPTLIASEIMRKLNGRPSSLPLPADVRTQIQSGSLPAESTGALIDPYITQKVEPQIIGDTLEYMDEEGLIAYSASRGSSFRRICLTEKALTTLQATPAPADGDQHLKVFGTAYPELELGNATAVYDAAASHMRELRKRNDPFGFVGSTPDNSMGR